MIRAVDAFARKSMLLRHGAGGFKHVETKNLWVPEAAHSKDIEVVKIAQCMHAAMFLRDQHVAPSHETHQLRVGRPSGTRPCWAEHRHRYARREASTSSKIRLR